MRIDTSIQRCSAMSQSRRSSTKTSSEPGVHEQAAIQGVQIVCMQEVFTRHFCAEQEPRWYESVEKIPDGLRQAHEGSGEKHGMVVIVPIYEEEITGVYYNTAAVIDADGKYLGKYRKNHIPHTKPGFWEKYYFKPGNLGYPTFETAFARVGVYICYDRHFPEGARALGLNGAEIVFNPSATVAGLSEYLWELEQPAHAVANGYSSRDQARRARAARGHRRIRRKSYSQSRGKIIAQLARFGRAGVAAWTRSNRSAKVWQSPRSQPWTYDALERIRRG